MRWPPMQNFEAPAVWSEERQQLFLCGVGVWRSLLKRALHRLAEHLSEARAGVGETFAMIFRFHRQHEVGREIER